MKCVDETEVLRLFSGQLSGEREELVRMHFQHCRQCASLRDELCTMTTRLAHDSGEFEDGAAVDEVMALIRMGQADRPVLAPSPSFWRAFQTWLLVPTTAAATVVLMLLLWPRDDASHGFQPRGSGARVQDRWVSLEAFRERGGVYEPVQDRVAPHDALAFTYLNRADGGFHFLTVVGVDELGEVFWYYAPSVAIRSGTEPVELPEQVQHELEPGGLRIFGLFSARPLTREEVEAQLTHDFGAAGSLSALERVNLPEVGQHALVLTVQSPPHGPPP